ncbi:MAG TPA: hypothetical protein VKM72_34740 [Thermoanaerobaculia bacterium]|nr:hypothetical protein [Thermoanaerobaculia bacterium]
MAAVAPPVLRAVLLGASNLVFALPVLIDDLRRAAGGPVEVLAACGHGRSYGRWSRLLFLRHLPGITECGLWPALEGRPPLPTVALVTDVGNDLGYGEMPETVAAWIETCLVRLAGQSAATVCTFLPLVSLEKLSAFRYYTARSILFPGRRVSRPALLERARELDRHLHRLAGTHGARTIEPQASWYGIDPIHVRRRLRRRAWDLIFAEWSLPRPELERRTPVRLPLFGAAEMRLFGLPRRHAQPACRLTDGTTVALY